MMVGGVAMSEEGGVFGYGEFVSIAGEKKIWMRKWWRFGLAAMEVVRVVVGRK